MQAPPDFDWFRWRLLTSPRLSVSLAELEDRWTLDDVLEAHEALDLAEDMEILADLRLNDT